MTRWWPRSLFGQLLAVLAGVMFLAQLLSAAINFAERDERIVAVLNVPPLVL